MCRQTVRAKREETSLIVIAYLSSGDQRKILSFSGFRRDDVQSFSASKSMLKFGSIKTGIMFT